MLRLCFLMHLVPGQELDYERRHDEIWPEMSQAVSAAGFTNYSLFRRGLNRDRICGVRTGCEDGPRQHWRNRGQQPLGIVVLPHHRVDE